MTSRLITLTPQAVSRCKSILQHTGLDRFQFGLQSGGCVGFQYHFQPVDTTTPIDPLDETITIQEVPFQICGKSLMYLIGTKIDWTSDMMEQKFVFENPQAGSQCGCGTSFQINLT